MEAVKKKLRVYVAGSSRELDRAQRALDWVRASPRLELALDWVTMVRVFGRDGPKLTPEERRAVPVDNLREVESSDVLWLLVPGTRSVGCWAEVGAAFALGIPVVASGPGNELFLEPATYRVLQDHKAHALIESIAADARRRTL